MIPAMIRWLLAFTMLLGTLVCAEEFLDPALAFKPTARALDGQTLEIRFEIAKGYYLYRDRFRFAVEPATVELGTPLLPPGKEKRDDTFGDVEVYYHEAIIRLPVVRNTSGPLPLTLVLTSQGCADAGICYPPQQQKLAVQLPDPATAPLVAAAAREGPGRRVGTHRAAVPARRFLAADRQLLWFRAAAGADPLRLPDDSDSLEHHHRLRAPTVARCRTPAASRCRWRTFSAWPSPMRRPASRPG
jgi:hypothetical protein